MHVEIVEESPDQLADYARVPIAFVVREVFDSDAINELRRGVDAVATTVPIPYEKDYDAHIGNEPGAWPARFDVSGWIILAAYLDRQRVGGVVLIVNDPTLDILGGQPDVALLWDLRVAPDQRGRGIGAALLDEAERAAIERGARELRVETQQINVPACRFYFRHGFSLATARSGAYTDLPEEVQLVWARKLAPA